MRVLHAVPLIVINPPEGCLDELALAQLAEGTGTADERAAWLAHAATCPRCTRELAEVMRLLADPDIGAGLRQLDVRGAQGRSRRALWIVTGLAAAAAVVLMLVPLGTSSDSHVDHRGPTITAASTPRLLRPIGDVAGASTLVWSLVPGAAQYRMTLFDVTGRQLLVQRLADTLVTIPDSVRLVPGQSYFWKVEAEATVDRWTASELIEFRVDSTFPRPLSAVPVLPPYRFVLASIDAAFDSLRRLVPHLSDAALVAAIKARPGEVREALSGTLALAVHDDRAQLTVARRLAAGYATAWRDSFLVRQVARFIAWPPERRAAKVHADSLRRAGVASYGTEGAAAAIALWRKALAEATAIDDSAGMASTLGNIGSAQLDEGHADSAAADLERARLLAHAVGDMRVEANAFDELAGVCEARDDMTGARTDYARAIGLHERIGDRRGLAADYNNLAALARETGDLEEARRQLTSALAINRRDGRTDAAATNLVNLAALASLTGDFVHAEAEYRDAVATWRARKQSADLADGLRGLGELEIRRGNYPAAHANLLEAMQLYDRTGPVASAIGVRERLAMVRAAEGELQGALDELRHAQSLADSTHVGPAVAARIALARADLAAQLNTRADAAPLYALAEQLASAAGDRATTANAQQGQAVLLLDQHQDQRAADLLASAFRIDSAIGERREAALVRVMLGELLLQRGDTDGARRHFSGASADLTRVGDPIAAAAALGERAGLEAAAGMPLTADSLYRDALALVGTRIAPAITWRLHAGLGEVRRTLGATAEARRELLAAIAEIDRSSGSLVLAERRSTFHADKWDVYERLATLERNAGQVASAFDVSERLRAREMLEMLGDGRVTAPTDTAGALAAKEQDLRRYIGELTNQLEGPMAGTQLVRGPDISKSGSVTRETLLHAQQTYTDLLLEIRERAPRHATLVAPVSATSRNVGARLAPDQAFIEYLMSEGSAMAFLITRDTMVALDLPVSRRDLAGLVDFVRGTIQPRGSPRLDSLWRAPLRQLHRDLIAPLEATGLLAGKTRLTIVPHAELHYLPFAALLGGQGRERFLVERYQLTVTPSASVWLALGARPAHRGNGGMLALAPRPDALPGSREEVAAIERLGGAGTRVLIGSAATEAAFRQEAPTRSVIHLATYGVLNKQNPLFSYVELASGSAQDGRLEAHEVFGLRLVADLVVLSACQTALASGATTDVPAGDDWIGLTRAFLSAGAARVMATLWPVQDRATATLMERFYRGYTSGRDPAAALATSQRALIASPATASPYYWAGFELVGGP